RYQSRLTKLMSTRSVTADSVTSRKKKRSRMRCEMDATSTPPQVAASSRAMPMKSFCSMRCRAGFRACRFTGLSNPVFGPGGWKVAGTGRQDVALRSVKENIRAGHAGTARADALEGLVAMRVILLAQLQVTPGVVDDDDPAGLDPRLGLFKTDRPHLRPFLHAVDHDD